MSDVLYSVDEWNKALESAENNYFDGTDAEAESGPLAAWLCEQYTHDKVSQDSEVLEAVINVLEDQGYDAFSPETYMTVLLSYRGETMASFRHLVQEYMVEQYGFDGSTPGDPDEDDYRKWYLDHCRNDDEVYTGVASGSGYYWFLKNSW